MTGRVRRRTVRALRGLTRAERHHLLTGDPMVDLDGTSPFAWKDRGNVWHDDVPALRRAWRAHRDDLLAEAGATGLVPWAAREFERMAGDISPYEHLRVDDPRMRFRPEESLR